LPVALPYTRPIAFAILLAVGGVAVAQSIGDEQALLRDAKRDASAALARADGFERAAAEAEDAAGRARARTAALSSEIDAAEADIAAARARVRIVAALMKDRQAALAASRKPVTRLAAALQTMARRPVAITLLQPGSVTDIVHVRSLLATMLPAIRKKTAGLRTAAADAERLATLADAAVETLRSGQRRLADRRAALARLERGERARSLALTDSAMREQDRALALGAQARDMVDQMQDTEARSDARVRLSTLAGPIARPVTPPAGLGRREAYRLPVSGRVTAGLGELSDGGYHARGITFATAGDARVIAPAPGRIAYSGPFRRYGRIAIIKHGGGWTTLVTGLRSTSVTLGDRVLQGDRLGTARGGDPRVTVELRRGGLPVDIVALIAG
jgi:septal ring factor EnvC (AmiA/AmiB activator)